MLEYNLTVEEELADLNNNREEQCAYFGKLNADKNANENSMIHLAKTIRNPPMPK